MTNFCSLLYQLLGLAGQEYADLRRQLVQDAKGSAVVTQVALHGLAAATAAVRAGRDAWPLLVASLAMLGHLSREHSAARRMLTSSLSSSSGARLMPQLLTEVVAALPSQIPVQPAGGRFAYLAHTHAAELLACLYRHLPAQPAPTASLRPADWAALACYPKLARGLWLAAAAAGRLGDGGKLQTASLLGMDSLATLCRLFPNGTRLSSAQQLATWCDLVRAGWLSLAAVAAWPQMPAAQRSYGVQCLVALHNSFLQAASDFLPPVAAPGASRSRRAVGAARPGLDVLLLLPPLLRLSRMLCQAAYFLAQADAAASPAAALLQEAKLPDFWATTSALALQVLTELGSSRCVVADRCFQCMLPGGCMLTRCLQAA